MTPSSAHLSLTKQRPYRYNKGHTWEPYVYNPLSIQSFVNLLLKNKKPWYKIEYSCPEYPCCCIWHGSLFISLSQRSVSIVCAAPVCVIVSIHIHTLYFSSNSLVSNSLYEQILLRCPLKYLYWYFQIPQYLVMHWSFNFI